MSGTLPIPGKQYTIRSGDTLQSIAIRAYGSAAKWHRIYRANASVLRSSNADLIYPGEVIYIPSDTDSSSTTAQSSRFSSRDKGTFNLVIGSREVPVLSGRFRRGVDLLASSWTAEIPWTPGADEALDKLIRRYSYAASSLYLGPTLVASGKLYGVSPKFSKDGTTKSLEFFTSTADLIDSTMRPPYEFSGKTLKVIANELCPDLGYEVVFDVSPGASFDTVAVQKTEAIGSFLQRLSTQRGLLCSCDEYGRVVFLKASTSGTPVDSLEEGRPIPMQFEATFDGRKRYAVYRAVGQAGDGTNIVSIAKDSAVPGTRQLTFTQDDTDSANIATGAAWKRSKALADALSTPFPVSDWYTSSGDLWPTNAIVSLKSPVLDLPDPTDMLIRSVEYVFESSGRSATLNLVPPFSLAGTDPEEPWI